MNNKKNIHRDDERLGMIRQRKTLRRQSISSRIAMLGFLITIVVLWVIVLCD